MNHRNAFYRLNKNIIDVIKANRLNVSSYCFNADSTPIGNDYLILFYDESTGEFAYIDMLGIYQFRYIPKHWIYCDCIDNLIDYSDFCIIAQPERSKREDHESGCGALNSSDKLERDK